MSQEPEYDDSESLDDFDAEGAEPDSLAGADEASPGEVLPFGMSGVTGILHKLRESGDSGEWSTNKQKMVAEYILGLTKEYWLSVEEKNFCREVLAL